MFPQPTELLLIGCLIESIWTPRLKSKKLTPKTNSQKKHRKVQVQKESQQNLKADDEFGIEMPCKGFDRTCTESTFELVKCAADRYGETRNACWLIKLLRMEQ